MERQMATQQEIASQLDRAAQRADMVATGATKKQVWFLAGLLAKAGEDADSVLGGQQTLSAKQASFYIDQCLKEEKLVATGLTRQQARVNMLGA
jgi:hypothetical protein